MSRLRRLRIRAAASAVLLLLALLLSAGRASADSPLRGWDENAPESGDDFMCIQHVLAAEGRNQAPEALLEMARVIRDKGACFRDRNWLAAWGVAVDVRNDPARACWRQYHCQGFFEFESISHAVREPLAVAAHIALTEDPPTRRYHFDAVSAPLWWWWLSAKSCPNGYWEIDRTRFC